MTIFSCAKNIYRSCRIFLLVLCVFFSAPFSVAEDNNDVLKKRPRLTKMLVIVGNGLFETVDGSIMLDGLQNGDGLAFQKEIMKRSDSEIEQLQESAIEFFATRYGIDVFNQSGIFYTGFQLDPRANPKVFYVSDEEEPVGESGWSLSMGGWGVFVVSPEGITLGGEFEGVHAPFNTVILYGDQRVERDDGSFFSYHLESHIPTVFDKYSTGAIKFRVVNDEFGEGFGMGAQMLIGQDPSNPFLVQNDARNIFTFYK